MQVPPGRESGTTSVELTPQEQAIAKAASAWVTQLARTLKTCRLYDANNPTVVKFREELAASLAQILEAHGALTLKYTSEDVLWGETSLYPARSREDNLGLPFYRDGIRSLTFKPGIEPQEIETLLDLLLRATSRTSSGGDDLVSLLWDAELLHVEMSYVSADADVEGGNPESQENEAGDGTTSIPWPGGSPTNATPQAPAPGSAESGSSQAPAGAGSDPTTRSEDWITEDLVRQVDAILEELESRAEVEQQRFREERDVEVGTAPVTAALSLVGDCLVTNPTPGDCLELSRFLARLLREAVAQGVWSEAQLALDQLRRCQSTEWSLERFLEELAGPDSVVTATAVIQLDSQGVQGVQEFLALGRALGTPAVEWLMRVLAESQQQRTRRPLTKLLAELCRDNPERLAPYLSDERWYVVRNVVHILGWIGGNPIAGLLRASARHPERRVGVEVVAALAQVEPGVAKPILLDMLGGADTRLFCAVLHQLAASRDAEIATMLLGLLRAPEFARRPTEEMRAIYSALAATGGDAILPELEEELNKTKWFSASHAAHCQALVRCVARIGTPAAKAVLERGAKSRSGPTRDACRDAMGGSHPDE